MKYADALRIAEYYVEWFRPACKRIEIKGSICRGKAEPKDIEILAVPDVTVLPRARVEFGKPIPKVYKTRLDEMIAEMVDKDICFLKANGDKLKKIWLLKELIQIDLFLVTPPAEWGVLSVIRTGPSDFSHWMVTRKSIGGALPDSVQVKDGAVWLGYSKYDMPEEVNFFKLCGMEYVEPSQRAARWGKGGG